MCGEAWRIELFTGNREVAPVYTSRSPYRPSLFRNGHQMKCLACVKSGRKQKDRKSNGVAPGHTLQHVNCSRMKRTTSRQASKKSQQSSERQVLARARTTPCTTARGRKQRKTNQEREWRRGREEQPSVPDKGRNCGAGMRNEVESKRRGHKREDRRQNYQVVRPAMQSARIQRWKRQDNHMVTTWIHSETRKALTYFGTGALTYTRDR